MDQFIHLPEFQVIVCKKCKYAVLPSHIDSHFAPARPHGFKKQERQRIQDRIAEINGLIGNEETLKRCEFQFPPDTSEPIAALAAPRTNGLRCMFEVKEKSTCPYVCNSMQQIQEHSWKVHGWKSTNTGGRPKKYSTKAIQEVPWRSGVLCQQFFAQGHKSGYFEVGRNTRTDRTSVQPQSQWEKLEKAIDKGMSRVEEAQHRKIEAIDESREPNPWLRRTGWARHLGGFDREKLRELVRPVDKEEEPELELIHQAFDRLIRAAQEVAVTEVVGQAALFEANRKEHDKKASKPFNSRMDKTTFKQYTGCWKQLLSYISRADDLEEDERPSFKLTSSQQLRFDGLIDITNQVVALQEKGQSEEQETAEKEVESQVLQFCIALLDHRFGDNQYKSGMISGLAVIGFQEGGRWANAEGYTPKLSAIKLASGFILSFSSHPASNRGVNIDYSNWHPR